jgi:hypothetical protein
MDHARHGRQFLDSGPRSKSRGAPAAVKAMQPVLEEHARRKIREKYGVITCCAGFDEDQWTRTELDEEEVVAASAGPDAKPTKGVF